MAAKTHGPEWLATLTRSISLKDCTSLVILVYLRGPSFSVRR
jgi:hypothetical protein